MPRKPHKKWPYWPKHEGRDATTEEVERYIAMHDARVAPEQRYVGPHFCPHCQSPSEHQPCNTCRRMWESERAELLDHLRQGPPVRKRARKSNPIGENPFPPPPYLPWLLGDRLLPKKEQEEVAKWLSQDHWLCTLVGVGLAARRAVQPKGSTEHSIWLRVDQWLFQVPNEYLDELSRDLVHQALNMHGQLDMIRKAGENTVPWIRMLVDIRDQAESLIQVLAVSRPVPVETRELAAVDRHALEYQEAIWDAMNTPQLRDRYDEILLRWTDY